MAESKFATVDAYIRSLTPERRESVATLRTALRTALPNAEEVISYSMPAFRREGIVVWYAAAAKHYALYVYPRVKDLFEDELHDYKGTKSSIHFEYGMKLPIRLVTKIAKESLRQNLAKAKTHSRIVKPVAS